MASVTKYRLWAFIIGGIGWTLLIYNLGWWVGFALLCVIWGNNLERKADLKEELKL